MESRREMQDERNNVRGEIRDSIHELMAEEIIKQDLMPIFDSMKEENEETPIVEMSVIVSEDKYRIIPLLNSEESFSEKHYPVISGIQDTEKVSYEEVWEKVAEIGKDKYEIHEYNDKGGYSCRTGTIMIYNFHMVVF